MKLSVVTNKTTGLSFTVRIIEKGQPYGRDMCLTHDDDRPMIEFYDVRYKFSRDGDIILGQFVSRYYVETIKENGGIVNGLNLEGGVADWKLDASAGKEVMALLTMWGL